MSGDAHHSAAAGVGQTQSNSKPVLSRKPDEGTHKTGRRQLEGGKQNRMRTANKKKNAEERGTMMRVRREDQTERCRAMRGLWKAVVSRQKEGKKTAHKSLWDENSGENAQTDRQATEGRDNKHEGERHQ